MTSVGIFNGDAVGYSILVGRSTNKMENKAKRIKDIRIFALFIIIIITLSAPGSIYAESDSGKSKSKSESDIKAVMKEVNKERKKKGLKSLKWDKKLKKGTNKRAKEITTKFSHTRPNGKSGSKLLLNYVSKGRAAGECLGMGYDEPKELVKAFMKSKTHKDLLMSKRAEKVVVSKKKSDGVTYWVVGLNLKKKSK